MLMVCDKKHFLNSWRVWKNSYLFSMSISMNSVQIPGKITD